MKIITTELFEKLQQLAGADKSLNDLIYRSNVETFSFSIYKNDRYKVVLEQATDTLKEKLEEFFSTKGNEEFSFDEVEGFYSEQISEIVSSNLIDIPDGSLLEMTLDNEFCLFEKPDYEITDENFAIHARSFLDQSLCTDLKDLVEEMWKEIKEDNNYEDPEEE